MRKFLLFITCLPLAACKYKDHNNEIVKPEEPVIDTLAVVRGNAASLVDQYLNRLVSDSAFAGAAFISCNDTLLLCKGYGIADSGSMSPYTTSTLVTIDAFEDFITAAEIMSRYQQNNIQLKDVFSTYFSKAPSHERNITVHQLLTHSSGFYDTLTQDTIYTLWQLPFSENLAFKPGTTAKYAKLNTLLLQAVIGNALYVAAKEDLDLPLNIHFEKQKEGHYFDGNNLPGGIQANIPAKKLFNWMWRLTKGEILPDSLVQKMFTAYFPVQGSGGVSSYGYGCQVSLTRSQLKMISWGENKARVIYYPEEHLMIGLIGHHSDFKAGEIIPALVQLYFDGYISTNAAANLHGFEYTGSRVLYTLMIEKGEKYFKAHALERLLQERLPENEMFFLEAGQKLMREKKWGSAKALYLLLTERFPENTIAWNDLGEVCFEMKEMAKAKTCFEQALKVNPENERAKRWMEKIKG